MATIGDFEFASEQLLGKGAWGEVYLGKQISLNRPVAIKILKKDLTQDAEFVRRFQREAQCLAKVADEHIIQVYGAGEFEGSYFFVMEYVQGHPLQKFLDKGRKFNADEVIYVGMAVAKAMKTAWESPAQIIHRDIKPSNIMVSFSSTLLTKATESREAESSAFLDFDIKEAKVKVMDFGLAKARAEEKDATLVGTVIGTPKYISPEQGLGNPADIRSDIYSLGIVLYEMATGRIPFESDTALSLIRHHIYDTPTSPTQLNKDLPLDLEAVILKCIQKDPNHRYQGPGELLEDLDAVRQSRKPQYASQIAAATGATMVIRPQEKKRGLMVGMIIIGVLVATAAVIFLLKPRSDSGTPIVGVNIPVNPMSSTSVAPVLINQFPGFIAKARTAIQLKDFPEAQKFIMDASALQPESPELKKLIEEYRAAQPVVSPEEAAKKVKSFLEKASLEIDANNLEAARNSLIQAVMADPDYPGISEVREKLNKKEAQQPNPEMQKIQNLISEAQRLMEQPTAENIDKAIRKLTQADTDARGANAKPEITAQINALLKTAQDAQNHFQAEKERQAKKENYDRYFQLGAEALNKHDWPNAINSFAKAKEYDANEDVDKKLTYANEENEKFNQFKALVAEAQKLQQSDTITGLNSALLQYQAANELHLDYKDDAQKGIEYCNTRLGDLYDEEGQNFEKQKTYLAAISAYKTALKYNNMQNNHSRERQDTLIKLITPPENMVYVDGGDSPIGKDNKNTSVEPFFIDKYEVTNQEYKEFLDDIKKTENHGKCNSNEPKLASGKPKDHTPKNWKNGSFPPGEEKFPVVGIDWYDAYAYAAYRDKRLPGKIEWEKAARGPEGLLYPWGNNENPENANVARPSEEHGKPGNVNSFPNDKSPYGCFDMAGSVEEWTNDFVPNKPKELRSAITGGGSFFGKLKKLFVFSDYLVGDRIKCLGFRCAKSVK